MLKVSVRAHFLVHSRGFNTEFSQGGGLPWWLRGYSVCLQCGRPGFDPWVGKIPWRRKWQPTPVLLPGESHGRRSLGGSTGLQRVDFTFTFRKLKSQVMQSKKKKKKMQRKVNAYSRVSEYGQSKLLFPSTHICFEVLNFFLDSSCKNVPSIPYCDCVILSLNCFTLATTREEFLICLSSYWTQFGCIIPNMEFRKLG